MEINQVCFEDAFYRKATGMPSLYCDQRDFHADYLLVFVEYSIKML